MNLGVYALGRLDADECPAVLTHLELCAPCREELAELEEAAALMRRLESAASLGRNAGH
jgi:anti-sigma factor ChrR (cupin superfamily)